MQAAQPSDVPHFGVQSVKIVIARRIAEVLEQYGGAVNQGGVHPVEDARAQSPIGMASGIETPYPLVHRPQARSCFCRAVWPAEDHASEIEFDRPQKSFPWIVSEIGMLCDPAATAGWAIWRIKERPPQSRMRQSAAACHRIESRPNVGSSEFRRVFQIPHGLKSDSQ